LLRAGLDKVSLKNDPKLLGAVVLVYVHRDLDDSSRI
jgi:hypothetical protein